MAVYLLSGTPGQSKVAVAQKIAAFLKDKGVKVGTPANVEEELLGFFPEKNQGTSRRERRVSVIGEHAQDEIRDKWPEAYKNAVEKAKAGNPDVAIVLLCFEYYRHETYEFYSPVDSKVLGDSEPRAALTLIDDIYDIYYQLSQPGQVFDIQELIVRTFPPGSPARRDDRDLRQLYNDALGVVIGTLLRLLTWREKEIECAANISRNIGCDHSVLAAKHPIDVGARLLLGSHSSVFERIGASYPVYVSHPISRPRRDREDGDAWPPFVDDLDGVVKILSEHSDGMPRIVPIMPPAIDEFRMLDDGSCLHPHLTPRWKPQSADLLFTLPDPPEGVKRFENYEDYESRGLPLIFDPPVDSSGRRVGFPISGPEVSGMLRNLRESIRLQMAGRDHLLVRQCPGLFMYRPLYGEHEFSGGVLSEIHTYDQIRKYTACAADDSKRRVAIIHDMTDAVELFAKKDDGFPGPVHQASSALNGAALRLVDESNVKTKRPQSPKDETVAEALQTLGNPEDIVHRIHDEMFPRPKAGAIGGEEPLDWGDTQESLTQTVKFERIRALSGLITQDAAYTYSEDEPLCEFRMGGGEPDTYVDVVKGLDEDKNRQATAAARVRPFFVSGSV